MCKRCDEATVLSDVLSTMKVPHARRSDIPWLYGNLVLLNYDHPRFWEAERLLRARVLDRYYREKFPAYYQEYAAVNGLDKCSGPDALAAA